MKKMLRNTMLVFLAVLLLLIVGDFFNFPLWPIDMLATNFPVDVQIDFAGIDSTVKDKLLSRPQYIDLELCKLDGTTVRRLNVDTRGVARFVIRQGAYSFRASVPVVQDGDWYFMVFPLESGSDSGQIEKIHKGQANIRIVMEKTKQVPAEDLDTVFRMYLMEADFESAGVFARDMAEDTARDMDTLLSIQKEMEELPVTAYNSLLRSMAQAVSILDRYDVPTNQQNLSINGETLYLAARIDAVTEARNNIVSKYLELLQIHYADSQLIELFQEWNHLVGNDQIYDETLEKIPEFADDFAKMEEIVSTYSTVLPDDVALNYNEAVTLYESGELVEARKKFSRLLSFVQSISNELEFEDIEDIKTSIIGYIEDVELITAANYAMRTDRLEKALQLYDLVSQPTELVHERIRETQRYMQLKGMGTPE